LKKYVIYTVFIVFIVGLPLLLFALNPTSEGFQSFVQSRLVSEGYDYSYAKAISYAFKRKNFILFSIYRVQLGNAAPYAKINGGRFLGIFGSFILVDRKEIVPTNSTR
jgi:hypothetical protein